MTSAGESFASLNCSSATQPLTDPNTGGSPVPAGTAFAAGPGKTLTNVHVNLIFWGAWWTNNPLAGQIIAGVKALLAGPYFTYLAQYGVHRGDVRGTTFVLDSEPGNGQPFTIKNVTDRVQKLLDDDQLPEPDDNWPNVYAFIMPINATFTIAGVVGQNTQVIWNDLDLGDVDNDPAYCLWVGNDGTANFVTTVFSHELAELATDPNEGNGVRQIGCTGGSCQIGDPGTSWCDIVSGVKAQSYWSIADNALVLPRMYSVRRTLAGKSIGGKLPRTPSTNAWIASQF